MGENLDVLTALILHCFMSSTSRRICSREDNPSVCSNPYVIPLKVMGLPFNFSNPSITSTRLKPNLAPTISSSSIFSLRRRITAVYRRGDSAFQGSTPGHVRVTSMVSSFFPSKTTHRPILSNCRPWGFHTSTSM